MIIDGKNIEFGKGIDRYTYNDFEKMCLSMPVFINIPEKRRNEEIKCAYGKLTGNVKQVKKTKCGTGSRSGNAKPKRGDSRAEQGSNDGRENIGGKEDKAEVHKPVLRQEEKKNES